MQQQQQLQPGQSFYGGVAGFAQFQPVAQHQQHYSMKYAGGAGGLVNNHVTTQPFAPWDEQLQQQQQYVAPSSHHNHLQQQPPTSSTGSLSLFQFQPSAGTGTDQRHYWQQQQQDSIDSQQQQQQQYLFHQQQHQAPQAPSYLLQPQQQQQEPIMQHHNRGSFMPSYISPSQIEIQNLLAMRAASVPIAAETSTAAVPKNLVGGNAFSVAVAAAGGATTTTPNSSRRRPNNNRDDRDDYASLSAAMQKSLEETVRLLEIDEDDIRDASASMEQTAASLKKKTSKGRREAGGTGDDQEAVAENNAGAGGGGKRVRAANSIVARGEDVSGVIRPHNGQVWAIISILAPRKFNASKDDMMLIFFGGFKSKKKATKKVELWRELEPRLNYDLVRTRVLAQFPKPKNVQVKTNHANKKLQKFLDECDAQQQVPKKALEEERAREKRDEHDTLFPITAYTARSDGSFTKGRIVD